MSAISDRSAGDLAKASDMMVEALEREGVKYIFGIPGEENLDLLESLRHSKIELVITRHEQAAGFMAATVGRLTGKIGVCLSTLGPGATNFMTAASYAQLGAMPMMMITGQKPIKKSKQARFQIIDVVEMMKPVTKYAHQIVHGATIPAVVRDAVRLAEEERPGAVCLELPEDIAEEEVEEPSFFDPHAARRPAAEEKADPEEAQPAPPQDQKSPPAWTEPVARAFAAFYDKVAVSLHAGTLSLLAGTELRRFLGR